LTDRRWRKDLLATGGSIDRKMLELFLIVELKNRIAPVRYGSRVRAPTVPRLPN
jgi:hypothetical protein